MLLVCLAGSFSGYENSSWHYGSLAFPAKASLQGKSADMAHDVITAAQAAMAGCSQSMHGWGAACLARICSRHTA